MNFKNRNGNGKASGASTKSPDQTASNVNVAAAEARGSSGHQQPGAAASGSGRESLLTAIRGRWGKLGDSDMEHIETREDLSAAIQSKYGITAEQADTQVQEWAVDRQIM